MQTEKDLKSVAKEAKRRLKSGFWEKYGSEVHRSSEAAKSEGVPESRVIDYYQNKSEVPAKKLKSESEKFYEKVKKILDEKGQVGNIISLLIDHAEYDELPYERKQKYILELSGKYLEALERYRAESLFKN
ncbi:MAG: hypothetical protein J5762_05895 [Clostridia bacterium]|nr:hypothetical protein [Clostridia bacterium]